MPKFFSSTLQHLIPRSHGTICSFFFWFLLWSVLKKTHTGCCRKMSFLPEDALLAGLAGTVKQEWGKGIFCQSSSKFRRNTDQLYLHPGKRANGTKEDKWEENRKTQIKRPCFCAVWSVQYVLLGWEGSFIMLFALIIAAFFLFAFFFKSHLTISFKLHLFSFF